MLCMKNNIKKLNGKGSVNHSDLNKSRLFTGLGDKKTEELLRLIGPEERKFQRSDTLWHEGDLSDGLGLLQAGILLCQRYHSDGKVQLVRLFEQNDIINVEASVSNKRTSPTHIIAATSGYYMWLPNASLFENPKITSEVICILQTNLLAYLADDTIRYMKKTDILSRRTVRERVLMYLNILREMQGNEVQVGMSQEEFAHYLCVDRSSLSEELNKMRREGLIEYRKKTFLLNFPEEGQF